MQLAVFDLDGTITRHDTLVPYVFGFAGRHPWRLARLPAVIPALIRYVLKRDRGNLKSALIRALLGGAHRKALEAWTVGFVSERLKHGVFRAALEKLAEHRRAGDLVVVMSASVDLYVPALARALDAGDVVCTGVRWDGERLDGRLSTPNRRGEEKVRCLEELRRRHRGLPIVAYGNARSDLAHLARADKGILVNGTALARRDAQKLGLQCLSWA